MRLPKLRAMRILQSRSNLHKIQHRGAARHYDVEAERRTALHACMTSLPGHQVMLQCVCTCLPAPPVQMTQDQAAQQQPSPCCRWHLVATHKLSQDDMLWLGETSYTGHMQRNRLQIMISARRQSQVSRQLLWGEFKVKNRSLVQHLRPRSHKF